MFVDEVYSLCPRLEHAFSHAPGQIDYDYAFIDAHEINRHCFYDWLKKEGLRFFLGSRLYDAGAQSVFTSLEFTSRQEHAGRQDIHRYQVITGHIANAKQIAGRLNNAQIDASFSTFLQGNTRHGIIGLDAGGKVQFMNEGAEKALLLDDGLSLRDNYLNAWQSATNRTLQSLIAAALKTSR